MTTLEGEAELITKQDVQRETLRLELITATKTLKTIAGVIGLIFAIAGVVGFISGIVIALQTTDGGRRDNFQDVYDRGRVWLGVAISAASIIEVGLVLIYTQTASVIARYVRLQAEQID